MSFDITVPDSPAAAGVEPFMFQQRLEEPDGPHEDSMISPGPMSVPLPPPPAGERDVITIQDEPA
jgi:hypothetical protein